MKTGSRFFALTLVILAGVQLAFSWGNATHAYFARQLGAKCGPFNLNEMYGALLPDCFNLIMTEQGQYLAGLTHAADQTTGPVWNAAKTPLQKSLAFGFLTHYQGWGADYTAHVDYSPFPTDPPHEPLGYMIGKGYQFAPTLFTTLKDKILYDAGITDEDFAQWLAVSLGHDLSETAVDLLVKRNLDPAVGLEMMIAAKTRPSNAGKLLADAYAENLAATFGVPVKQAASLIIGAEKEYREYIMQYGRLFCLPEQRAIALLAEQTAPIAELYIEGGYYQMFGVQTDVHVTPEQVATFIAAALAMMETDGDYDEELAATMAFVEAGLLARGVRAPHMAFGHEAEEGLVQADDFSTTPTPYALAQNTPNPFNPSTTIGFSLPAQSHVRLAVYNALGQEVATLVDDERPAGSYTARWDASQHPSGAYFYRIESGSFVETKRMMLVK